jgi:hypothetical protein
MLKGGSGAAGGGHRISTGQRYRTRSSARRAQTNPQLLSAGAVVGFDARPGQQRRRLTYGSARNVGQEPAQARLDLNARRTRRPRKTR